MVLFFINMFPSYHSPSSGCLVTKTQSEIKQIYQIPIMKANEMHYFSNLFDKLLYMFRTGPLSIIRSIPTLYTQQ